MENNEAKKLSDFTNNLKRLYGEYYLIKMTKEEEERYIRLYSKVFNKTYEETKLLVRKIIKNKKRGYGFAIYNSFKNILIERYGEFYFIKMTFEERKILVDHYYKAKRGNGEDITKDEAFNELYSEELEKYQNKIWDYQNAMERLEFMYDDKKKL